MKAPDPRAVALLVQLLQGFEGCILRAYPDPGSKLAKELRRRGLWRAVLYRSADIPAELLALDGAPWTIGYGETDGVTPGMVWTKDEALDRLRRRAAWFLAGAIERCPALARCHWKIQAACGSLAYNIGLAAWRGSAVASCTARGEYDAAADAFWRWRFAGGEPILAGRRQAEAALYRDGAGERAAA